MLNLKLIGLDRIPDLKGAPLHIRRILKVAIHLSPHALENSDIPATPREQWDNVIKKALASYEGRDSLTGEDMQHLWGIHQGLVKGYMTPVELFERFKELGF